ncbi:DUF6262 family protein [Tsukamurella pulmonis]|uniref:DUF6262 family protein n=1 Tax=Tsukamurella pulmonis TaxID=47312 RepID=UPI00111409B3|nr:DUF6262 family protein [Tsukamurella pulmonis]
MKTSSDARTQHLVAARRAAAAGKQTATLDKIDEMVTHGEQVSFTSVHRAARVSTWFVYNNPTVRLAIETAIQSQSNQNLDKDGGSNDTVDDRTAQGLRTELANARGEIRDLRGERDRLRRRVQRNLGDQLDATSAQDLAKELCRIEDENTRLRKELHAATAEIAIVKRERDVAIADRDGAQLALRQMIRKVPN